MNGLSAANIRRVRLAAAVVLFAYLILHFTNHALGMISLKAMEAGRYWFLAIWRNPVGTVALYGSVAIHAVLGLWLLYQRPTLRMPMWELWQYLLGLLLPPLLATHVTFSRINWWWFGTEGSYVGRLIGYWVQAPLGGVLQAITLVLAWSHACIGVHYALRFRSWYARLRPWLLGAALLLPTCALAGYLAAGREVQVQARNPGWVAAKVAAGPKVSADTVAVLARTSTRFIQGYFAAVLAVFVARGIRALWWRRRAVRVSYSGGKAITVPVGSTILDASRLGGIPHASVCGGRGRCSTCRVLVLAGHATLPPQSALEKEVLTSVRASQDIRLACQTRPTHDVTVMPFLAVSTSGVEAQAHDVRYGHEQPVAVLFADLRGFTRMAELKLPYDTVYILNRYFEAVGSAIAGAGGMPNQFTGDGVMALFGIHDGAETGCRQALAAVRSIAQHVARLSTDLAQDLPQPMRLGIGLHVGPAVIGQMGWKDTFYLTAVGDTVHVAARLEQATKDFGAELVVSEDVVRCAGVDFSAFPGQEIAVRNREKPVAIRVVPRVADLYSMRMEA